MYKLKLIRLSPNVQILIQCTKAKSSVYLHPILTIWTGRSCFRPCFRKNSPCCRVLWRPSCALPEKTPHDICTPKNWEWPYWFHACLQRTYIGLPLSRNHPESVQANSTMWHSACHTEVFLPSFPVLIATSLLLLVTSLTDLSFSLHMSDRICRDSSNRIFSEATPEKRQTGHSI